MFASLVAVRLLTVLAAVAAVIFALTDTGRQVFSRRFRGGDAARRTFAALAGLLAATKIVQIFQFHNHVIIFLTETLFVGIIFYIGLMLLRARIAPAGSAPSPKVVLAIGAHPDDLELACSGSLTKLVDNGSAVHLLVLSDGRRGGDHKVRLTEAQRGARFMQAASLSQHHFTDTRMADEAYEMVQVIEERIAALAPDLIITHSANDQHQDHQAAHIATLRAARQHSSILCYESPSATRHFSPSFFVDIGDYVDTKVYAVSTHRNQMGKPYMKGTKLRGMSLFRGSQAKVEHAEGFEVVRMLDSWSRDAA